MSISKAEVIIIGGGFFGMYLAEYVARQGKSVMLFERDNDFMKRASYNNQARVHNGYHYPRSILTALRSRISFPKFCEEFPGCIDDSFEKYYMIGKLLGKVTAKQFKKFCIRIGAPCNPASQEITDLVNPKLIESVFSTVEYVFDATKLKQIMKERIESSKVHIKLDTLVQQIKKTDGGLVLTVQSKSNPEKTEKVTAKQVFNCTYSMTNFVLTQSRLQQIPLKHEMTEICLVEVPKILKNKGITVMCGPFFSVMPFPDKKLHSFSHVRYTPHYEWRDQNDKPYINPYIHYEQTQKKSAWKKMQYDGQRYMPVLSECKYKESLWEIKTVLPRSETDDSRPILFKPNYIFDGFHCIIGGKIDNIYDMIEIVKQIGVL